MHPLLKQFCDQMVDRYEDLVITPFTDDGGYLRLKWLESEVYTYEVIASVHDGDDAISFEYIQNARVCLSDPLSGLAEAFACHLFLNNDSADNMADPGTFAAIVWIKRHNMRIFDLDRERTGLLRSIARLNGTED